MAQRPAGRRTLFDKLWDSHAIVTREDGQTLLWVDRHFVHEGSFHAFDKLKERGAPVARPDLTFGIADHYVPTRRAGRSIDPAIRHMVDQLRDNTPTTTCCCSVSTIRARASSTWSARTRA